MKNRVVIFPAILVTIAVALIFVFYPKGQTLIFDDSSPLTDTPENLVFTTKYATIDATTANDGYITVKYLQDMDTKVKVQIQRKDSENKYLYNIREKDIVETFPLTDGDGEYKIKLYKQVKDNKYAILMSKDITVKLVSEFAPFVNPSQYINYTDETKCVVKAKELTANLTTDIEKVDAVFNFVVDNFTYDYDLANSVQSGYVPELDKVFDAKKGICFDYSATMAAMLRSQKIPCKMIFGYTGNAYHAWVNVYIKDIGWVDKLIQFNGKEWTLMDPTFVSTGNKSEFIMNYVTTKTNYIEKYAY